MGALTFSATILFGAIALWPKARIAIGENLFLLVPLIFVVCAAVAWVAARLLEDSSLPAASPVPAPDIDPHDDDYYVIRNAKPGDAAGVHGVARSRFPPETLLSPTEIARWMTRNSGIFRVLVRRSKRRGEIAICGYYAVFPLRRGTYEKLKGHQMSEKDIRRAHFTPISGDQTEALYILDIAIHEGVPLAPHMVRDGIRHVARICAQCPNLEVVGTWGFRPRGAKIASQLGFRKLFSYPNPNDGAFYEVGDPHRHFSAATENAFVRAALAKPYQPENQVTEPL